MANYEDFIETKRLMHSLWPKWTADEEVGRLLNERWAHLHQDKLRECIRNHRFIREVKPDITAIHKAYCDMTAGKALSAEGEHAVERTRREALQSAGPTQAEYEEWDRWAKDVLATATKQEIAACEDRMGMTFSSDRVRAVAVEYCRRNGGNAR